MCRIWSTTKQSECGWELLKVEPAYERIQHTVRINILQLFHFVSIYAGPENICAPSTLHTSKLPQQRVYLYQTQRNVQLEKNQTSDNDWYDFHILALCDGNPSTTDGSPHWGPIMCRFEIFVLWTEINSWATSWFGDLSGSHGIHITTL